MISHAVPGGAADRFAHSAGPFCFVCWFVSCGVVCVSVYVCVYA